MRTSPTTRALAGTVLGVLLCAVPAAAHSDLVSTEPSDGAQVPEAPGWVVLRFDNPIDPSASSVRVLDGDDQRVDRDDLRTEGATFRPTLNLSLQDGLAEGVYTVRWRILSDDGHPNSGRFSFAVGLNTTPPQPGGDPGEGLPSAQAVAGRILAYAGLALGLGAAAWLWLIRPGLDGVRPLAIGAIALGALLHALGTFLLFRSTLHATGLDAGALAASDTGRLLALRIVVAFAAAGLAAIALARPALRLPAAVAAAVVVVAALATAAVGHAAGEGLPGLLADALHLLSSATWAGALLLFFAVLRRASRQGLAGADVRRIGLRFGTVALACVVLLVASGISTALVILGRTAVTDPLHLTGSLYGRLLLAKVGLAGAMILLGAANRYLFLGGPAADRPGLRARLAALGPDGTSAGLRRTVLAEAALGLLVLAVAGCLTAVSPSDHEALHEDHSAHLGLGVGGAADSTSTSATSATSSGGTGADGAGPAALPVALAQAGAASAPG